MSLAAVPAHDERERVRGKSRKSGEERLSPRCSPNETKAREERGESGSGGVGRLRPLMHCEGDGGGCWRKGKALGPAWWREREEGRRDGALAGRFGPSRPRRERGEKDFPFSFFKPNFQIYFQIEILNKLTFCF